MTSTQTFKDALRNYIDSNDLPEDVTAFLTEALDKGTPNEWESLITFYGPHVASFVEDLIGTDRDPPSTYPFKFANGMRWIDFDKTFQEQGLPDFVIKYCDRDRDHVDVYVVRIYRNGTNIRTKDFQQEPEAEDFATGWVQLSRKGRVKYTAQIFKPDYKIEPIYPRM